MMKTMKRTLSVILAVFMLVSALPFTASAADPIALTEANVTVWPTASGEIYFGQKISDGITLSGGEVQHDGVVVAGHFEFIDTELRPTSAGNQIAALTFIPKDSSVYAGFNVDYAWDVTYKVNKTIPVFVDENNTIPIATAVEPGARLSTSELSGASMKNPYMENEPNITNATWEWSNRRTKVNESGYFEAEFCPSGYELVTAQVYVKIKENTVNTTIAESPSVGELTYDANKTWADVTLIGGKAVEEGTETEVTGTFAITKVNGSSVLGNKVITDGDTVEITFTPSDTDKYLTSTTTITATVNKAPVKFVDSEGKEIVPEIELGYNPKDLQYNLSEIKNLLKPYANCGEANFYCNWQDLENKDLPYRTDSLEVNTTKEYIIRGLSYDSDNYAPAMLTFKLKVVPRKLTATVRYTGTAIYVDTTKPLTDKLYGTFEYYANGEKIGTSQITTYTDSTGLQWKPEKSGVYDITVKFVPDEKDVYYFDDTTVEDMEIICAWGVTVENGTVKVSNSYKENGSFKYGEDVSVQSKTNASFSHWIVTDTKGNEIEIEGFDKNKSGNTFKMPDFSVKFKAVDLTQRKITCVNCFVKNAVGTADAPIRYKGQKVSIGIDEAALPLEKFAGWEITDSNGNAYMPEGLTEEALASTNIEFTMPDFDITVKAKNVDDEKGDGFLGQIKAFFENLFAGDGTDTEECPVLKWLRRIIELIVAFFTGFFNGLVC